MRKIIFTILIIIGCALQAQAQNEYERLRSIYDRAEENYNIGRLDEAEKELTDNLKDFPDNLRQSAYRLLALCNLGNDKEEEAEEITRLLLATLYRYGGAHQGRTLGHYHHSIKPS